MLLVIATLGVMILGYFVMKRIDTFIDGGGIIDSPQGRRRAGFLVFGSPNDANMIRANGFSCAEASKPQIPADIYYSALFALSENDAANLQICHEAKIADSDIFIIVHCHDPKLHDIYLDAGADYVLQAGQSLRGILAGLDGASHEK